MLRSYFESVGISVRAEIELATICGEDRVTGVRTVGGETIACDTVLVAAGMTANRELAADAGLRIGRGVIVDEQMCTSDPDIFAVGDVAEFAGHTWGLWTVAVRQAQVAATVIAGGDDRFVDQVPKTTLKGCGLDVVSFGSVHAEPDDVAIVDEDWAKHRYRKVVLRQGRVVGGVFLGLDADAVAAEQAVEEERRWNPDDIARLGTRDWTPLRADPVAIS